MMGSLAKSTSLAQAKRQRTLSWCTWLGAGSRCQVQGKPHPQTPTPGTDSQNTPAGKNWQGVAWGLTRRGGWHHWAQVDPPAGRP